ncbi:hypothetical protein [Myroides sp. LJL119]
MKNSFFAIVFFFVAAFASAQVKTSSTSLGLNLGGVVSVFFEDNSDIGLTKKQYKEIQNYKRRYEKEYDSWYTSKHYSDRELRYKRDLMVKNIRIDIENLMTLEQRNYYHSYNRGYYKKPYYKPKYKKYKGKKHHKHYYGKRHH